MNKPYTKEYILELLDKYNEAETSLQEEHILQEYFLSDSVDKDLLPYKSLFTFLKNEQKITAPEVKKEGMVTVTSKPKNRVRRLIIISSSIAASLLLGIGLTIKLIDYQERQEREALAAQLKQKEMMASFGAFAEAISLVATNLDKGLQPINSVNALNIIEKDTTNQLESQEEENPNALITALELLAKYLPAEQNDNDTTNNSSNN
jgi:hypothetical protein